MLYQTRDGREATLVSENPDNDYSFWDIRLSGLETTVRATRKMSGKSLLKDDDSMDIIPVHYMRGEMKALAQLYYILGLPQLVDGIVDHTEERLILWLRKQKGQ